MFFITEQDPNFRIKGSRDPLGFQSIWQKLGRNVIKYLSTVSINIKDFQVLSYAWYFYEERDPKNFLSFFYKFEQACGFARGIYMPEEGFNGIDFVRKNLVNDQFSFSTRNQDTLLSNQKSYGIYGKYNRPFTDIRIKEQKDFRDVMENSLKEKLNFNELNQKISRLLNEDVVKMNKEDLLIFAAMINTLKANEKDFYEKSILKVDDNHVQNELYDILKNDAELVHGDFHLYGFIEALLSQKISDELKAYLIEIKNTEKVLVPYSFLFKTIQSEPIWNKKGLEEIPLFNSFPKSVSYPFQDDVTLNLSESLKNENYEITVATVNRNIAVSDKRGNSAWMKFEHNKLLVCYADGARDIQQIDEDLDNENNYFIPTYISMFKQIML